MPDVQLNIPIFLEKNGIPVIDVRSPAEFEHGHIPGALNMPLFSNEERSVVGTLYLQRGSSEAMLKGLEIIGPRMKEFAETALKIAPRGEAMVYCWRGGMRSSSMSWLLNTVGIKASSLAGGYKSYRRFVHDFFAEPFNLFVIGGMTGSGKTEVLEELESAGKQVIHLERLANHKGSVFGGIGMSGQPTTEQFENDLFNQLRSLNPAEPVFIEDESLAIGNVFIPRTFFDQMVSARGANLTVPSSWRVKRLVRQYACSDRELLVSAAKRIEKRLGLESTAFVIDCIIQGKMEQAIETLLSYYDKVYGRSMSLRKWNRFPEIRVNDESADDVAMKVFGLAEDRNRYAEEIHSLPSPAGDSAAPPIP